MEPIAGPSAGKPKAMLALILFLYGFAGNYGPFRKLRMSHDKLFMHQSRIGTLVWIEAHKYVGFGLEILKSVEPVRTYTARIRPSSPSSLSSSVAAAAP